MILLRKSFWWSLVELADYLLQCHPSLTSCRKKKLPSNQTCDHLSINLWICLTFTRWRWKTASFWKRCQKWSIFKTIWYWVPCKRGNHIILKRLVFDAEKKLGKSWQEKSLLLKMVDVHKSAVFAFVIMTWWFSINYFQLISPCWIKWWRCKVCPDPS